MAVSRDQAARVLRQEAETPPGQAGSEVATEKSVALAEQLRSHVAEETKRRNAEAPEKPVTDKPAAPATDASAAAGAPNSGKRKFVLMGVGLVLALAADPAIDAMAVAASRDHDRAGRALDQFYRRWP